MARPRKKDALDIPQRAIDTAKQLLQSRGAPSFSLSELARDIGCSAPALYNHFASKDDLLRQLRSAAFQESIDAKKARYSDQNIDPLQSLHSGGLSYLTFAAENPALYRLIYCPAPGMFDTDSPDLIPKASLDALAKGITACQDLGYAVNYDANALARTMWSTVHGAAILALDMQSQDPNVDPWPLARQSVETIMQLIREG